MLLLGLGNRLLTDFADVPVTITRVSAMLMAALLAAVIWSYQHADQ